VKKLSITNFMVPIFPCHMNSNMMWLSVMYQGLFLSGKQRSEHEADHSSPFFVRLEKAWNYISIPPCVFMAYTGINLPLLIGHTLTNFPPYNNTVALLITQLSAMHTYIVTSRVEVSMEFHIVAFWIAKLCQVLVDHTASIFKSETKI